MLRLRRRETDVLDELLLDEDSWIGMTAQHAPDASHDVVAGETMELRGPDGPNDVVRLGPTVTQVAGFGVHDDVMAWLAEAMTASPLLIRADAFDDVVDPRRNIDHLAPEERQTLVDRVLDLADRAREIEAALVKMTSTDASDVDDDWASAALSLAAEWDACAELDAPGDRTEAASREIDLRARTAQILGRLPGPQPEQELRDYAHAIVHRQENPDTAVALRSELDRLEAEGRDLVARIDAADGIAQPAVRVHEMFDGAVTPVIIDGDVLDAVAPSVHDLLLDKIRSEADRRRVVIIYDDTTLDAWLATVHGASVWTTGHLHLVHTQSGEAELEEVRARAGDASPGRVSKTVGPCAKHPSALTRLNCNVCKRACCSACLVRVNTKDGLLCIDCALERGTGVKRRGR